MNISSEEEIFDSSDTSTTNSSEIPIWYSTIFSILYALITILSLIGNTIILIVILRRRRMRVVTNFFLANITIANLIYTCCAPLQFIDELYGYWVYNQIMCPLLPFFSTLSINVNTMSMIAASIERLVVIVFPYKPKLTKKNTLLVILFIWIFSILTSLPWIFLLKLNNIFETLSENIISKIENRTEYDELLFFLKQDSAEIVQCDPIIGTEMKYYYILLCILQYFLPLLVLMITYSIIAYYIYFINSRVDSLMDNKFYNHFLSKNKKKLIKMLVFMIICFNICWLPLQMNAMIRVINENIKESLSKETDRKIWMVIHLLAFSHFCYNPFINGLLNKKFKQEIISLFKTIFNRTKQLLFDNRFYTCIIKRYDYPLEHKMVRICLEKGKLDHLQIHQYESKFKSDPDYLDEFNNLVLIKVKEAENRNPRSIQILDNAKLNLKTSSSSKISFNQSTSSNNSNTSSLANQKNKKFNKRNSLNESLPNRTRKRSSKSIVFKLKSKNDSDRTVDFDFINYNRLKYLNFYSNCNLIEHENVRTNRILNKNKTEKVYDVTIMTYDKKTNTKNSQLTCDLYNSINRGPKSRVISFALYGNDAIYFKLLKKLVRNIKLKYPGWLMRIYHDNSIDKSVKCKLECMWDQDESRFFDLVDFCNIEKFPNGLQTINLKYMHGMTWRWLPLGDSFVDFFLSRDTDSLIEQREIDSFNVWFKSNTLFHVMRDHPRHGTEILGGGWGYANLKNRELGNYLFKIITIKRIALHYNPRSSENDKRNLKGFDQFLLSRFFWKYAKKNSTIHDSYTCMEFGGRPWPTQRIGDCFFGCPDCCRHENRNSNFSYICPIECRPKKHLDWIYC
ncbi:unnamed protein product [Brachionus calyciflorus]|uniref:G-protein coupled receptors family 1 profile domain-containing protein n=1 Tax=Brachionus calyciflorus TaxID=104777 RepID=A0A814ACP2_9BILA|nr:unnamed protein product [Brachionus calyciflorus]